MYKPANIRSFVISAIHQKATIENSFGVDKKVYVNAPNPNLKGEFKQKTSSEVTANGLVVDKQTITYTTWYKSDVEPSDRLIIGGVIYNIKGCPDNCENRKHLMVCYLERIQGGA